jgi:hypothetical protein
MPRREKIQSPEAAILQAAAELFAEKAFHLNSTMMRRKPT